MARPVGSLAVRLTADTSEFQRRMQRATRNVNAMARKMRSAVNTAGKYGAAIAAAGIAIGTHLVKNSMQAIDRQSKLARQLGTTQASIASLTRAAELSGVEQKKLEKNIQAYNKRLGEAIDGSGEAKAAMDKMGLSAQELAKLPLDEQMAIIADKVNGLGTAAEKAAVASDLFSRAGLDMINLFEGGSGAIEAARAEAEAFGLAVDDVDARQIEMTNDAMSSISATMRGFFNRVAVKLAPIIKAVADRFRDTAVETQGFQSQLDSAVRMAIKGAQFVGSAWRGVQVIIKGLELGFSGFNLMVITIAREITSRVSGMVLDAIENINWLSRKVNEAPLGIELPLIDSSGIEQTNQFMDDLAASAREKVDRTKEELHALLMEPLPLSGLNEWVEEVQASARAAAKAVQEEQQRIQDEAQAGAGTGKDEEAEKRRERLQQRLTQLRESLASEREAEIADHQQRMEILRESLNEEMITKEEFQKMERQQKAEHEKELTRIEKEGLKAREKFVRGSMKDQAKTIFGELSNITSGVAQHNKTMFQMNKVAGIANAVINAYEGISKTMSAYPYPYNIAMAAAHAAAAFAQVNAIRSASFSGGGGSAPALAGGTAAAPVSDVGGQQQGGGGGRAQTVTVNLQGGDDNSRKSMRDFVEQLNDFIDDGGEIGRFAVA